MSVINQMLQDLDQRAALAGLPTRTHGALGDLTFGTEIVRTPAKAQRLWWPSWRLAGILSAFVMAAWGGVWLQDKPVGISTALVALPQPLPVVVEPVAVSPVMAAEVLTAPSLLPLPAVSPVPQREPVARLAAQAKPVATAKASRPSVAVPTFTPAKLPQLQQGLDASPTEQAVLAQAQSMWRSGLQAAAIELLNQAVAAAERDQSGGVALAQSDRLAVLVRELARMQLMMGQASLTMDLLVRLTPALSGYPDIWAIRGNVAQRLGQHQASVDAYAMALKVRPDEPRWLLGSAVSLATLGQLKAAAEMAEKARDQGRVSPEAMAYLEQLGVTLLPR